MHLAAVTATAIATAPLQATKRSTLLREEQAKNVLVKSSGYERGTYTQPSNTEVDHDFDTHVVTMQDSILRIYIE